MKNTKLIILLAHILFLCSCSTLLEKPVLSTASIEKDYLKADEHYNQGLISEAEWRYKRVVNAAPELDEAWLKLGNIYTRTQQLGAAKEAYASCIEANPQNNRCWNNRALVYIKEAMNTLEEGERSFESGSAEQLHLALVRSSLIRFMSQ